MAACAEQSATGSLAGPMIKHTIEISKEAAHLSTRNRQLLINRNGTVVGRVPCEDIGVVLVDHPAATYTHSALAALAENGATVVVCGRDHLPAAMLLPLAGNSMIGPRQADQLAASVPLQKRLWQQIIRAKILAQADNLADDNPLAGKLADMATAVRSGDPNNLEAQAARHYWSAWRPCDSFRRDPDGQGLNGILNYGYAVLRAAVARAVVAAGLNPTMGIHHHNRSNSFCLADDLMEPLRPLVDDIARELWRSGCESLDPEAKASLLELLTSSVKMRSGVGPLMVSLHRYVASLVKCFAGETKQLDIPEPC